MYFFVNASPSEPLDVATWKFTDALVRSKAGICDGVPSTEVLYSFCVLAVPKFDLYSRCVTFPDHTLFFPLQSMLYKKSGK